MSELAKSIVDWLLAFFGLAEGETSDSFVLASKVFRANGNLRLATKKEDERVTSTHTGTAHNTDTEDYIPVRDKRMEDTPLVLKPVTGKGSLLAYAVVLDTDKVSSNAHCESFAKLYMTKTLKLKKTFESLQAAVFARQSGEDIINNTRGKELRKLTARAELLSLAAPFVVLPVAAWDSIRDSMLERDEALTEVIDELRAEKS